MTHEFDRAQVVHNDLGNWLCLHIKNAPMARVECEQMKEGKTYTAEVKKKYDKRSGRANAYAWQMMSKLAAKLGIKREKSIDSTSRKSGRITDLCRTSTVSRETLSLTCGASKVSAG